MTSQHHDKTELKFLWESRAVLVEETPPKATSDDAIEYVVGRDVFIQEVDGSLSAVNQVWQDLSTIC